MGFFDKFVNDTKKSNEGNAKAISQPKIASFKIEKMQQIEAQQNIAMQNAFKTQMLTGNDGVQDDNVKYMVFDKDSQWIGVTPDAPEYLVVAYKNYKKNN